MIDMSRLRIFVEVVRQGSFTAAAGRLSLTQPAVSQQVATLERELGVRLLDRSPRTIRLTEPGELLMARAHPLLEDLARVETDLRALARDRTGEARLAMFPSAFTTVLPPIVAGIQQLLPDLRLHILEQEPPESLRQLAQRSLDAALVYDYPDVGAHDPPGGVKRITVGEDELAAVLPVADRRTGPIRLADLADRRWIAPRPSVCRNALIHATGQAGFVPTIAAETDDYAAMQALVAAGFGVALVPRLALIAYTHPGVRVLRLTGRPVARELSVDVQDVAFPCPHAADPIEIVCGVVSDILSHPWPPP